MTTIEMLKKIEEAHNTLGYNYFGLRTGNENLNENDCSPESHDWDFENDCESEDTLGGTCCTGIDYLYFDGEEDDISAIEKSNQIKRCIQWQTSICYRR